MDCQIASFPINCKYNSFFHSISRIEIEMQVEVEVEVEVQVIS